MRKSRGSGQAAGRRMTGLVSVEEVLSCTELAGRAPGRRLLWFFRLEVRGLELGNDGDNERKGWMWETL